MRVKSFIDEGRNKINYQGKQLLTVRNLSDDLLRILFLAAVKMQKMHRAEFTLEKFCFVQKLSNHRDHSIDKAWEHHSTVISHPGHVETHSV